MMLLIKRSHLPQSKSKSKRDKKEEAGSKHEWLQLEPLSSFAPFYIWFVDLDQRKRTCRTLHANITTMHYMTKKRLS